MMAAESRRSSGQALVGLLLLGLGSLLFAQNFGLLDARRYWRYWGVVPLTFGLVKLLAPANRSDRAFGVVLTVFGGGTVARALGYWSPGPADLAAIVLMGLGAYFVFRGVFGGPDAHPAPDGTDWVSGLAILAGFERKNNSQNFRGGDLSAFMGGVELDLRMASMRQPAVIDVFVMWGGVGIYVPPDWTVELRGTPLMAGFEDKTQPPPAPTEKRLVIRGLALMGGVEIKN